MMHLFLLLSALFLGVRCASDGNKDSWADFWKDVRGDNMEMKGFSDHSQSAKDDAKGC
jgi:hypothetical protein